MLKKLFFIALIVTLALPVMAGGSSAAGSGAGPAVPGMTYKGNNVSQPVNLIAYMLGDLHPDGQMIIDRVNNILKTTINATIEWRYLSWSEHATRYPLLFTARDEFDIIFTAPNWAHYESTAGMGGFEPITQAFVQRYAPDTWSIIPSVAWAMTLIDGVSYCVPSGEAVLRSSVNAIRGDLMARAGVTDITTYQQLSSFLDWVARNQNTHGVSPLGTNPSGLLGMHYRANLQEMLSGTRFALLLYNYADPNNARVEYILDQPWFRPFAIDMKRNFEAGWWSQDSLASTATFQENFLRGQAATFNWNIGSVINFLRQAEAEHPEWNVTFVDAELNGYKWVEEYNNNNLAISAFSKNKERAMMAINELYANKEINRLIRYGVEGIHYVNINDTQYDVTDRTNRYPIAGNAPAWVVKNPAFSLQRYIANPKVYELKEQQTRRIWETNQAPYHPLAQFTLDTSNITTQIAMINSLQQQYYDPVIYGMAGDVDTAITTLRAQFERAGIRDIIREAERQIQRRMAGR